MSNLSRGQLHTPSTQDYVGDPNTPTTYMAWTEGVTIAPVKRTNSSIKEQRKEALSTAKEKAKNDLRKILAKRGYNLESAKKDKSLWIKVKTEYQKRKKKYLQEIISNRQSNRSNTSSKIKKAISNSSFPLPKQNISKIDNTFVTKDKDLASNRKVVLPNGLIVKPGVNIDNLSPKLVKILPKIVEAYKKSGTGFKPWISSGNDSKDKIEKDGKKTKRRSKTSAHYTNEAIDLSRFSADNTTKEMDVSHVKAIGEALTSSKGHEYKTKVIRYEKEIEIDVIQYNWDTDGDGKRDLIVLVEEPGKDNQHMHIQIPKELRGK